MSANPMELFTAAVNLNKSVENVHGGTSERRSRARVPLHWPVVLFRNASSESIETVTENLSSSGFYCYTKVPLLIGEELLCAMKIPANDPSHKELERQLDCRVKVVRVEAGVAENEFGIACIIEDYHFVHAV